MTRSIFRKTLGIYHICETLDTTKRDLWLYKQQLRGLAKSITLWKTTARQEAISQSLNHISATP